MTQLYSLRDMLTRVGPVNIGMVVGSAVILAIFREPVMLGYFGGIVTTIVVRALIATEDN